MMELNGTDRETVHEVQRVIRDCNRYGTRPAPWFNLLLRLLAELEEAGLIRWSEEVEGNA